MENLPFYLFLLLIITINIDVSIAKESPKHNDHLDHQHHGSVRKLFVFGDSYADTGNSKKASAVSWKAPYGITFPGKPGGRFSDGRVLTDYLASFLGIQSPVPYIWRKSIKKAKLKDGMNFAFGGTGVFNTMEKEPNMSTQIDFFQQLIEQKFYTKRDLKSSIALVSVAGNDYAAYIYKEGVNNNMEDLANVTMSIVNQLVVNLKRIHNLGVPKIAVTALQPLGCLPPFTSPTSYRNCSKIWNSVSDSHNEILKQILQNSSNQSEKNVVLVLDLHKTFMYAFKMKHENVTGNLTLGIDNPLKPCCVGISNGHSCGSVDGSGSKKYTVCNNPNSSFFWDVIHPSQNGWRVVFSALRSSLYKFV
ncbi:GDSL esterase/lipase At5g03610 [Morus notabilis]|uniref:GDSL esterase/lipase At5g03610 n=1 Tax=Morus notabilis TaxID=981085 RepID=UPI000CED5EF1|nr:GDSL esterase/lipase At5g03610 [Morus notabilis]